MAESPLDDASERSIAFRRLICRISQQMTRDELKTLVYIRLYSCREAYKECSALEVLSKLESDGMFAPARPEGLADIAKDVRRPDLVHDVRDFMKGKKWHKKVSKLSIKELALARCVSDEEMQLRGTLEVTLTQAALLMLQLDALGVALGKGASQAAVEAVKQAEQTATAIADRLNRTQAAIGAKCTSYEEGEWGMEDYTQMYAIPVQADTQHTGSEGQEEEEEAYEVMKPPLDIRSSHETLLRAEHKPPAAPEYSIPVPKANRQQRASRRWIKQAYSEGDQLLPSPPPDVLSPRASVIKPVPPRKPVQAKRPMSLAPRPVAGLEGGCSDAYIILRPTPDADGSSTAATVTNSTDRETHEARQWMRASLRPKLPVLPKPAQHQGKPRTESHYYKSLNRTQVTQPADGTVQ